MIRHNTFYKILALAAALTLWFYVNSERNPQATRSFSVPVEIRNVARGYSADLLSNQEVTITVQGLKTLVDEISKEDITAWVTLREVPAGQTIALGTERVHYRVLGATSGDLSVAATPEQVKVRVEALSWKRLPVEVKFLDAPPLGYSYSDPQITPASVGLSGKTSEVGRVKRVVLALARPDGSDKIDGQFSVVPVDSKGNVVNDVTMDSDRVRLKLSLVEVPASKVVVVSPTITGSPKYPMRIARVSVMPSSVTLEGRPSALMQLSTVTTEPISMDGEESGVSREVSLVVPDGVKVLGRNQVRIAISVSSAAQTHP